MVADGADESRGPDEPERADGEELARRFADAVATAGPTAGGELSVVDERADPEPTVDGTVAYAVAAGSRTLAAVSLHPDRLRVEFRAAPDEAAAAATDAGLRVRPKATRPPRTLAFVESTDEVERALDVFDAVVATLD
ncbi:hypothetical protein [Halosimplex pelagicum]|uniref:DUF7993 domain-containing protein n=1 Tax=Halosimplex pelagicum TaxID=869886 RepID=A0A7D5PAT2_9EURY|nr:hypothetical protein [Halosimplex pelagicum]QLH81742.1 hypothetical protein HZS54_08930 [Halosimplex pelagicum]